MFEVGFTEILVIAVLALIVLGPEKLPRVARQLGRWMGKARAMARQFREQLEEEVTVAESSKTRPATSAGAASTTTAGAGASETAGESPTAPPMYDDSQPYGATPPPEVAAADAAAAETAHSDSTTAPPPEPEAPVYQPPAYANGSAAHTADANGEHEQPSAAQTSAVESPPSYPDDEPPRKAGDFITTTHERGI